MKNRLFPAVGVFLLILFICGSAGAFEAVTPVTDSVNVVETLKVLYDQTDPDSDMHFWALVNRLNITAVKSKFTAGVRYDTEAYFQKDSWEIKYWLEKAFVQWEDYGFFIRAGDFYNRMGDGLALSVLKRDYFGLDNTIRGGIVQYGDPGGHIEARVLGGSVNEYDGSNYKPERTLDQEAKYNFEKDAFPENEDTVYGGQMVLGMPGWGFVEGRYLAGLLRFDPELGTPGLEEDDPYQVIGAGMRWLNFGGHGKFAGEYAWYELRDEKKLIDALEMEGRAAYARLNLNFGPLTFLAEGQDYYRYLYPYSEPPILEFEKQTFGHAPDKEDILGGRGYAEVLIPVIEVSVFGNYYQAQKHDLIPEELADHYKSKGMEKWVEHVYGGAEKDFDNGAHVAASGGRRYEPEGDWTHAELDGGLPISENHELKISGRARNFVGRDFFEGTDYGTYSVAPSWNWRPWLSLTPRYEYSDEPLVSGTAGQKVEDPEFWSAEALVHAGTHVDVKAFYGRIRGGLVCSGGVCRNVPPFKGMQLDVAVKF